MLIAVPLVPTARAPFTPNTILLHIISLFKKTVVLIILNKTENHKDLCLKIYTYIFCDSQVLLKSTTF